jgi:glycosidase
LHKAAFSQFKPIWALIACIAAVACLPLHAQDFKKQVIYQIITDRFYDGDPANNDPPQSRGMYDPTKTNWQAYWGGDLAGIRAKLPYLKQMGITAIWISPSDDNINVPMMGPDGKPVSYLFAPYHGYINRDFERVEEHFGSSKNDWNAFDSLTAASHRDKIKIVLDFSPNDSNLVNTGEHGTLLDDGKIFATYDHDPQGMFHHEGTLTDINDAYQIQYYNVFGLADLNHDNPQVDRYIKDAIHQFQDHGVDAVRLDAVRHITWGWSYSFANSAYSHKPSFMFGEWFMGGPGDKFYDDACKFANKSGMSLLDYPLAIAIRDVLANDKPFSIVAKVVADEQRNFDRPNDLVTFFDNHDIPRLMTLKNDRHRLDEATALVLTSRGIPVVYYGDEQYLHNDTDGGKDPYTRPWMSSYDTRTTGFRLVRALADLRQTNNALAYGTTRVLAATQDVFVFERHFANDDVLIAINKNETNMVPISQIKTTLPSGTYKDVLHGLMSGSTLQVDQSGATGISTASLSLSPHSVSVWQLTRPPTEPLIGSIGPAIGQPGMLITLAGVHFGSGKGVVEWASTRVPVKTWADDHLTVTVPSVPSGEYAIRVRSANGELSNGVPFTVLQSELVPVTFTIRNAPAKARSKLYLTGNSVETGDWKTDTKTAPGPFLCPHAPDCLLDISVPAGKQIEFKLFLVDENGTVERESGPSHTFSTPVSGTGKLAAEWQR